jgi:hypothetical protein
MPAVGIAGSTFTVEVASADYSCQVTTGTITTTPTVTRTRTLCGANFTQTDLNSTMSINFLFDGNSDLYDALEAGAAAGTSVAVEVATGANGTWTGAAMWVDSLDVTFDAANVATCTVSLQGDVSFT